MDRQIPADDFIFELSTRFNERVAGQFNSGLLRHINAGALAVAPFIPL